MNHAITTLQVALATAENNEPIHRAEGNIEQADLCKAQIVDLSRSIFNLIRIQDLQLDTPPQSCNSSPA